MNKTLFGAVILLGLLTFSSSRSAGNSAWHVPVVIAAERLQNQTAPIPTTTIFTPPRSGLYRLSAYAVLTTASTVPTSYWFYNFGWTDDSGPQAMNGLLSSDLDTLVHPFTFGQGTNTAVYGPSLVFEAIAGTPVTYSVSLQGGAARWVRILALLRD